MIKFRNLEKRYENGMAEFLVFHKMAELPYEVEIEITGNSKIEIKRDADQIKISIGEGYQVFRALTIMKQKAEELHFEYEEKCCFKTGGPMFDGSQASSLMNIDTVKKMMLILAGMGFNMMMLYCEDCYEIDGEPYFGNMRPRYSKTDFKLLDDYAYALGIELIPCIQTLGHLTEAIKRPPYRAICDQSSVLLVGEEKVYELIDKMIHTMAECFRSRRIHLGLDETYGLGLGNYLLKNGYKTKTEIIGDHLKRVYEITQKYGLKPMMWCDMFFSAKSKNTVNTYYDPEITFDEKDRAAVPAGMSLVYWDYYHFDTEHYELYFDKVKYLSDDVIFAGCARNVRTFGCHYTKGKMTTDAAMAACKKKEIREFIITVWGDDHRESSTFAVLPQLQNFAEHMYSEKPEESYVAERFEACTNIGWDAMMDIDALDSVPGYTDKNEGNAQVSKGLMWQNILMGMLDANIAGVKFYDHYDKLKDKFKASEEKYPEYAYLFEFYYQVANVLKDKAEIGLKLTAAYKNKDMDTLRYCVDEKLPELAENAKILRLCHRDYFYKEYKPVGWEILDIRYGGLIMGIDTAVKRLGDYLDGKVERIEELEEKRLSFSGDGTIPVGIDFAAVCSASRI